MTTTVLTDDEMADFLKPGGTGVISVSRGEEEPPYSIPVSYGFDPEADRFCFRLARTDSEKNRLGRSHRPITFVTYGRVSGRYHSVIATGTLTEIVEQSIDSNVLDSMQRVMIPVVDIFEAHPREMSFEFYRLDPETMTGIAEPVRDEPVRDD